MTLKESTTRAGCAETKNGTRDTPIVLQRDRKLRRYDGTNETCEKWIDEARDCIKAQQLTEKHAAHYVTSSLSGHARSELKCHLEAVKDDAEKMFDVLRFCYGVKVMNHYVGSLLVCSVMMNLLRTSPMDWWK